MKIHPAAQGSFEWHQARLGLPTASDLDNLITPGWEIRKWSTELPNTYLARKLAEWWSGTCEEVPSTFDMMQGQVLEEWAVPWYEREFDTSIQRVGLCLLNDESFGGSPDGLIGDDCGIEIKCPTRTVHTKYLIRGGVPPDYSQQVHACMYVTGRKHWKFVSYRRTFPQLVVDVEFDEDKQAVIQEALALFNNRLGEAKTRLCNLNGGPPRRFSKPQPVAPLEPVLTYLA